MLTVLTPKFLSFPPRTVPTMSCTVIPDPLGDLLTTVAANPVSDDRLDSEQYNVAVAYGWVAEFRGQVSYAPSSGASWSWEVSFLCAS